MSGLLGGVDLGGTTVTCAMAQADGTIVARATAATDSAAGPAAVVGRIASMFEKLIAETGERPAAVGVGVPGLVDREAGETRFLPNFPGHWPDVPIGPMLGEAVGCEIFILNDVRTATLGELAFGRGRSARTMAFFAVGTGVGGGIVVDGRLRLGALGAAGELGHMTMLPDGPLCGCGNRGCLETLAAGPALAAEGVRLLRSGMAPKLHELVDGDISRVTPKQMGAAAAAGDAAVEAAVIRAGRWLGLGVANVVVVLHPELVVLGGGVAGLGGVWLETIDRTVRETVGMFPTDGVRIELSAVGADAGVLGAVALARARGDVGG